MNKKILVTALNRLMSLINKIIAFIFLFAQIFKIQMKFIYMEIILITLEICHFFNLMCQDAIIQLMSANLKKNINNLFQIYKLDLKFSNIKWILISSIQNLFSIN